MRDPMQRWRLMQNKISLATNPRLAHNQHGEAYLECGRSSKAHLRSFFSSSTTGSPPTNTALVIAGAASPAASFDSTCSLWMAISLLGAKISAWAGMRGRHDENNTAGLEDILVGGWIQGSKSPSSSDMNG